MRDYREPKEYRDLRDNKELKGSKEHRDARETREHRDSRDNKEYRDTRDIKEHRDARENKEHRDSKGSKDHKDTKDSREYRTDIKDSTQNHKETKKPKGWSKEETSCEKFDKMSRKYPPSIPFHINASSQTHATQLPVMKSESQTPSSSLNIRPSGVYNSQTTEVSNVCRTVPITTGSPASTLTSSCPTTSLETVSINPSQPTNRQLSPISELRNSTNHNVLPSQMATLSNYNSKHTISNPLNIAKTNLSLNINNQLSVEEDSTVYGSTRYR